MIITENWARKENRKKDVSGHLLRPLSVSKRKVCVLSTCIRIDKQPKIELKLFRAAKGIYGWY